MRRGSIEVCVGSPDSKPYLAEITTAATRGRWIGLLNSFYYCEFTTLFYELIV